VDCNTASKTARGSNNGCTCLGYLGQCDTNRICSIYVSLYKVAKASAATVAVACGFASGLADIRHLWSKVFGVYFGKVYSNTASKTARRSKSGCTHLGYLGQCDTNRICSMVC
jgi:hypothetical protein